MPSIKSIEITQDGIAVSLSNRMTKMKSYAQFFVRFLDPKIREAESKRFLTENNSEETSGGWEPLNERYRAWKLIKYAGSPGGGTMMLIATGRLRKSILERGGDNRVLSGDKSFTFATAVPYAPFVDEKRRITGFTPKFNEDVKAALMGYINR